MTHTALGLMSGTAHDGLDLCAVAFTADDWAEGPVAWRILAADTLPYDADWRARLLSLPSASAEALARAHADLGHLHGMLARQFLRRHGLSVELVASHGHTVLHQPHRQFTAQIGCGEALVSHVGLPVVADFRSRDVALGGQGAPLVPYGEWRLFDHGLFLNLGGIANMSLFRARVPELEPDPANPRVWLRGPWPHLAYDLCPANLALNHLAARYDPALTHDPDGRLAAAGQVDAELLARLEALSFYQLVPPRSLGREFFLAEVLPLLEASAASVPDQLATLVEHIGRRLEAELDRFGLGHTTMLVTGGGAHNATLIARLDRALAARHITRAAAPRELVDYKEALIFAWLGLCAMLRVANVLPGTTGAREAVVAGAIHLPEAYSRPLL